jgi:hypothetical protein
VLDKDEHPVIAYPHIDDAKTTHVYWYARWNGTKWKTTKVASAGHAFHQNWNQTERCYSGGMSLDPDNINDMYLSIPTKDGLFNKDGVYEIWRYTIDDDGQVASSEQITKNSPKNNARPFVIPDSKNSPMRVGWMQGDYYYWMVNKNYPKGYPTAIHCDYEWKEELTKYQGGVYPTCYCFWPNGTLTLGYEMNAEKYEGVLFTIENDLRPLILGIDAIDEVGVEDVVSNGKQHAFIFLGIHLVAQGQRAVRPETVTGGVFVALILGQLFFPRVVAVDSGGIAFRIVLVHHPIEIVALHPAHVHG